MTELEHPGPLPSIPADGVLGHPDAVAEPGPTLAPDQVAEAAAATGADPISASVATASDAGSTDAGPTDAGPTATAQTVAPASDAAAIDAAAAPAVNGPSALARATRSLGRGIAMITPTILSLVVFGAGLAIGWSVATTRQQQQAEIDGRQVPVPQISALSTADQPPQVVQEVISAIGADDGNLLAASLPQGPLTQIQNALVGVAHVRQVIPAGTVSADGQTVTAIQIVGEDASGQLFGIDLVIHTDSTGVVGFR